MEECSGRLVCNGGSGGTDNVNRDAPFHRFFQGTRQLGKHLWQHAAIVMMLVLAAQATGCQALAVNKTSTGLLPEEHLTHAAEFPIPAALGYNNTHFIPNIATSVLPLTPSQSSNGRFRRSTTNGCVVTEDELEQLEYQLHIINLKLSSHSTARSSSKSARDCQERTNAIKESVTGLKGLYITFLNNRSNDARYNEIKRAYETEIEALDKTLLAIQKNVEQQFKPLVDELIEKINDIQKKLSDALQINVNLQAAYEENKKLNSPNRNHIPNVWVQKSLKAGPFSPPRTCDVSAEWFIEVLGTLQDALSITSALSTTQPMDAKLIRPDYSSYNCMQLESKIKETVQNLEHNFNVLTNPQSMHAKYAQLNRTCEDIIARSNQRIVDLGHEVEQNFKRNMTVMRQELQGLNSNLTSTLVENKKLQEMIKNETMQFCISLIKSSDFLSALQEFSELNDNNKLKEIVRGAYANDIDNSGNILTFIRSLRYFSQDAIAYPALFEEMKRNNHLGSPQGLRLMFQVDEVMAMPNYQNTSEDDKNRFITLKNALVPYVQSIIEAWGSRIRGGDSEKVQLYTQQVMKTAQTANMFNHNYLSQIITNAYTNNVKNVDQILVFVSKLPWISQLGQGYMYLFNEIKTRNHLDNPQIIMLAYKVKEAMDKDNLPNVKEESNDYFRNIKSQLPSGVRALIWDPYVVLENKKYHYTLYGSSPGNIYTYPHNNYDGGLNQRWTVDVKDGGRYFRFINKQNEQAFYADDKGHAYGDYAKDDSNQYWQVIPINDGTYFYFKNSANGRILDGNEAVSCASSRLCCCTTVHAYSTYTGTDYQHWKIL